MKDMFYWFHSWCQTSFDEKKLFAESFETYERELFFSVTHCNRCSIEHIITRSPNQKKKSASERNQIKIHLNTTVQAQIITFIKKY